MDKRIDEYINFLIKEMELYKDILKEYIIDTIFIGGGTPTYIDEKHIIRIMEYLYKNYNTNRICEVTIEANPETVNYNKLKAYKDIGINRISLGLQTTNDKLLKEIGRQHTYYDFLKSYEIIKNLGFDNINVDLMFGLPNQKIENCLNSLESVADLGVKHISYYSLIIEDNTIMNRWYKKGQIKLPDEDIERRMYHEGIEYLKSRGYKHYEISNLAKEGFECKHNLYYWKIKPYIGFGIASHSNINNKRFWNYEKYNKYINMLNEGKLPIRGEEYINMDMEIAEFMIMGLRLTDGINIREFENRFKVDIYKKFGHVIEKYIKQGLLINENQNIKFTSKGLDLSNVVYVDLLPD